MVANAFYPSALAAMHQLCVTTKAHTKMRYHLVLILVKSDSDVLKSASRQSRYKIFLRAVVATRLNILCSLF